MERTAILTGAELGVGLARLGEGALRGEGDYGVEALPDGFQPVEAEFGEGNRCRLAGAEKAAEVADREVGKVGAHRHSSPARNVASGSSALLRR